MCGICGRLNYERHQAVDGELVVRMADQIAHRGPDGQGSFIRGNVGLAHRRLSIIDLSTGDQPMSNETGSVWVVFNGEIYNYRELRADLQSKGHQFKSQSDTEVIVHLYEEIGDACVAKLQGMFAFALWDVAKHRLVLARDRVGIKPLYYADTPRSLIFGSEIKALLADPDVERRIDPEAVDRFLTYYYTPGHGTMFESVRKLPPGHYLVVEEGCRPQLRAYWELNFGSRCCPRSLADSVSELRRLLRISVTDHMISDVPVGILLSGGLDSTGVLRYAAEASKQPLHTFTVGFRGRSFADERPYARLAAREWSTVHHELTIGPRDFCDFLPRYVWHMEELVCEPPAIALYFVSKLAREHGVKVLLSGEGGDEAFGGYPEYRNLLLLERLKGRFGRRLVGAGLRALSAVQGRLERYAHLAGVSPDQYYYSRTASPFTHFNSRKRDVYQPRFMARLSGVHEDAYTRSLFVRVADQPLLNQMLYVDSKSWLPDDLLVKADKMTMATSVELRVPLLDHRVLEFAATLPVDQKVRGFDLKRVLKAALGDQIPREILNRKKTGFPIPYDTWLRHELREFVQDTLLRSDAHTRAYVSKKAIMDLLRQQQNGNGAVAKELFCLLVLELWHGLFLQPAGRVADHLSPSTVTLRSSSVGGLCADSAQRPEGLSSATVAKQVEDVHR
jgi:asparagine synthase (glutamine-hydrolysing)